MKSSPDSSEAFGFLHGKFNKMIVYFKDESKQSLENLSLAFKAVIQLWDTKATKFTTFSEKGKLLVLVIRFFRQVQPVWKESSETFMDKVLNEFMPGTLVLMTFNELQDRATLIVLQEVLLELTLLCNVRQLPQRYEEKTVTQIFETSFRYKFLLKTSDNNWMEEFVHILCIKIKTCIGVLLADSKDAAQLKLLRYYNTKLIDLSKAFPNKAFKGTRHVIHCLYLIYNMMSCVPNNQLMQTNAIVPLLGFLEQVQVNSELFSSICDLSQQFPRSLMPLLVEIVKIISRNASPAVLDQYFGDHLDENLFEVLFVAALKYDEISPSMLSPVAVCLTLATSYQKAFQAIISRLITVLLSDNVNNAYWSINILIFIARISSKEICYQCFEQMRQSYVTFPKFTNSPQKFFVGKTMKVFYLCLKSKLRKQFLAENPPEKSLEVWMELGLNTTDDTGLIEGIFERTQQKILNFLKEGDLNDYHELVQYVSLCSTESSITPTRRFFEATDEIFVFLARNTLNLATFSLLVMALLKFSLIHVENLYDSTLTSVLSLSKELQTDSSFASLTRTLIKKILAKRDMNPTLSSAFKSILNNIPEQHETNNIKNIMYKSGYLTEIHSNHVCRVPEETPTSPVAKKRKLDTDMSPKQVALDNLLKFEMELLDTGIVTSIPELESHLLAMKSLLS